MNDAQRERVDEIFAAYVDEDPPLTPGVAYGVVMDGMLVHAGGLGTLQVGEQRQPGADSSFRIASMTKSFVAATLLLLRDEGVVRLDDTAEQCVPDLQGLPLATGDSRPPNLRQLLSMNSGYPEDDPWA
ncbi:MAG: serine hydrolase domain-containing protein, partial [Thermoleophilia bacterium]